jgi:multiple sugar transport system permease protein
MAGKKENTVAKADRHHKMSGEQRKRELVAWLLMLPSLVCFVFFIILPILGTLKMSFYSTKGMKLVNFLGFGNYKVVFEYPLFWQAAKNSVYYVFWSLIFGLFLPLIIAALCAETTKGRSFFRIAARLPGILPAIASLLILTYFLRSDGQGVLNILFGKIGLGPFKYLTNPKVVINWIVLSMTWKGAGGTALLYMAALTEVPQELYEAAALDGASPWQRFRYITWPAIKGQFNLLFILQIIGVFQVLYEPMVMTNGGPNNASLSMMLLMYFFAFRDNRYGVACAMGVVISLFLIAFSIIRALVERRMTEKERE